jgi:ornithine cyclodeaminase
MIVLDEQAIRAAASPTWSSTPFAGRSSRTPSRTTVAVGTVPHTPVPRLATAITVADLTGVGALDAAVAASVTGELLD